MSDDEQYCETSHSKLHTCDSVALSEYY